MFTLRQLHPEGGDCTAQYAVEFNKPYMLKELITDIENKTGEWGKITVCIESSIHDYVYITSYSNKISPAPVPDMIADRIIRSAMASGGWSNMDYCIRLKEEI